jgi:hypothetical protein
VQGKCAWAAVAVSFEEKMIKHDVSESAQVDMTRMLDRGGELDDLCGRAKQAPGEIHLFEIAERARQNQRGAGNKRPSQGGTCAAAGVSGPSARDDRGADFLKSQGG